MKILLNAVAKPSDTVKILLEETFILFGMSIVVLLVKGLGTVFGSGDVLT